MIEGRTGSAMRRIGDCRQGVGVSAPRSTGADDRGDNHAVQRPWDAIVVGLGAMGMAAAWCLASRGARVLGIDRHQLGHDRGSSHGGSRIVRQAYFEHADYVPLLRRADELWREIELASLTRLVHRCGVIYGGPNGSAVLAGVKASAQAYGIALERLTVAQASSRFSALEGCLERVDEFVLEPNAGFVRPERAILAMAESAQWRGAHMRPGVRVDSWRARDGIIEVNAGGCTEVTQSLILTQGAWVGEFIAEAQSMVTNTRQVMAWVTPRTPTLCDEHSLPAFFIERESGVTIYGVPTATDQPGPLGVKIGFHGGGQPCHPDALDRTVTSEEREAFARALERAVPGAAGSVNAAAVCMYSSTPDDHFVVDRVSTQARVFSAFGMGGHGFKFAPVIGSALADLAMVGRTSLSIGFLQKNRFARG